MGNVVTMSVNIPRRDISFLRKLSERMGWSVRDSVPSDALYDPESGAYLNEETMQAIRDAEAGKVMKCDNLGKLLETL